MKHETMSLIVFSTKLHTCILSDPFKSKQKYQGMHQNQHWQPYFLLAVVVHCSEKRSLANDELSYRGEEGGHKYAVFTGSRHHQVSGDPRGHPADLETAQQRLEWQGQYMPPSGPLKAVLLISGIHPSACRNTHKYEVNHTHTHTHCMFWKGWSREEKKGTRRRTSSINWSVLPICFIFFKTSC